MTIVLLYFIHGITIATVCGRYCLLSWVLEFKKIVICSEFSFSDSLMLVFPRTLSPVFSYDFVISSWVISIGFKAMFIIIIIAMANIYWAGMC